MLLPNKVFFQFICEEKIAWNCGMETSLKSYIRYNRGPKKRQEVKAFIFEIIQISFDVSITITDFILSKIPTYKKLTLDVDVISLTEKTRF